MMDTNQKFKWIFLGCLVVATAIIIFTFFRRNKSESNYEDLIKAKDETIQAVIRERDVYRQWKDDAINELHKADSMLQIKYKTNVVKYEKIPVTISNLSDEELRSAVENFR